MPHWWSSFRKKYIIFSVTLGGGGGSDPNVTNVTFLFFLMKASLRALVMIRVAVGGVGVVAEVAVGGVGVVAEVAEEL